MSADITSRCVEPNDPVAAQCSARDSAGAAVTLSAGEYHFRHACDPASVVHADTFRVHRPSSGLHVPPPSCVEARSASSTGPLVIALVICCAYTALAALDVGWAEWSILGRRRETCQVQFRGLDSCLLNAGTTLKCPVRAPRNVPPRQPLSGRASLELQIVAVLREKGSDAVQPSTRVANPPDSGTRPAAPSRRWRTQYMYGTVDRTVPYIFHPRSMRSSRRSLSRCGYSTVLYCR